MSDRMSKSAKGSMFDGLQIFGKTDAKFSLTNSHRHGSSSSSGRPLLNSNYEFNDSISPIPSNPPVQYHSLPSNINEEEDEAPPNAFPIEPVSLNARNLSPAMKALERTRFLNPQTTNFIASKTNTMGSSTSLKSNKPILTSSQPVPQQTSHVLRQGKLDVSGPESNRNEFSRQPPSFPSSSAVSESADLTTISVSNPRAQTTNGDSDRLAYFFSNASTEVANFETELDRSHSEHYKASESTLDELKASEDYIRTTALISIQKLLAFESSAQLVGELKTKIKNSIDNSCFEEAELLQNELDEVTEVLNQAQLLQFQPPRQITTTEEHMRIVSNSRKSHIDSMKDFCVNLDELSSKFTSLTKKIEVQCSSKIEKQKQEIDSSKNMLDCSMKHFDIDKEYLLQKGKSLKDELKVNTDDHELQMQYQEEQFENVQTEIRDLEERLKKLKLQERGIFTEKQKLLAEKVEFEKVYQQKSFNLQKEKEKIHAKDNSLKQESELLQERTKEFELYSSQLQSLKESQNDVCNKLAEFKTKTCDSISTDEGLIVNEVHVTVNSDIPNLLRVPEGLSNIMETISTHKTSIKSKSEEVFKFQRKLAQIQSDQLMNKSNLDTLKGLKSEAISRKQFQQASQFVSDETKIKEKLLEISRQISDTEELKANAIANLESLEDKLKQIEDEAAGLQRSFDEDCHKALVLNLKSTIEALKGLPPDMSTISKSILEYDACYTFSFLKMIEHRSNDSSTDSPSSNSLISNFTLSDEDSHIIKSLMKKIDSETDTYRKKAEKLKEEMELALKNEDFETAKNLNCQYESVAGFYTSPGEQ